VPEQDAYAFRNPDPWADGEGGGWPDAPVETGPYARSPDWFEAPRAQAPQFQPPWYEEERPRRRSRRIDPDYPWDGGPIY
jgi:hypothetical protein